jgi:hypothetical protein
MCADRIELNLQPVRGTLSDGRAAMGQVGRPEESRFGPDRRLLRPGLHQASGPFRSADLGYRGEVTR